MTFHILLVEGRQARQRSWAETLTEKGYAVTVASTRRETCTRLERLDPDLLILDCRYLRFDVFRLCEHLRHNGNDVPILLILHEGDKPDRSVQINAHLRGPFTARKLLNRVKRLLPTHSESILRAGDLTLDVQQQIVMRGRVNHRLTPKQTRLLEIFMRHPGQVLPRSFLMKQVWNTDFMGDTRTLEVHIHWLRRAIEQEPARPVHLITVRKIGYRFDARPIEPVGEDKAE